MGMKQAKQHKAAEDWKASKLLVLTSYFLDMFGGIHLGESGHQEEKQTNTNFKHSQVDQVDLDSHLVLP